MENIFSLVCELKESENHHSTSFEKLWVVVVVGGCTVIITSALLLLFLNLSTLSVEFRDLSKDEQEPSLTIY